MKRTKIKDVLRSATPGSSVRVAGWVRTKRASKNVVFLPINDGSTITNLQVVVDLDKIDPKTPLEEINTGASVSVTGEVVESKGKGQKMEISAREVELLGKSALEEYPLQPKEHTLEFMREIAHLRFRSNLFGAITRIRHTVIFGIHKFFNDKGFLNIHTPIITGSDCEGGGEMFRVTALDMEKLPRTEGGRIDFTRDFFGRETNLTVSGQLEGELAALAMSEIYTFGPTFRAENSNTPTHLAEFWMIEPEMAFYDLEDNMDLAEEFLKYLIRYTMDERMEDLEFLDEKLRKEEQEKPKNERMSMGLLEKLKFVSASEFARVNYTEAVDILKNSPPNKKKKFEYIVDKWGIDFKSEHERYLVEKHFQKPTIITDYPKEIKAFYMKQNGDGKTVRAMDVLFPGVGEVIGGSQREENHDKLLAKIRELGMSEKSLWWYLDTRKFGTVPHSGFGMGLERFMLFVTGMKNIRDVIPFPRTPRSAEF